MAWKLKEASLWNVEVTFKLRPNLSCWKGNNSCFYRTETIQLCKFKNKIKLKKKRTETAKFPTTYFVITPQSYFEVLKMVLKCLVTLLKLC